MKVIQISDTHLFANDESDIFGVKSNIKFKEVITKIINEDKHDTEMIFLTGDLSQDETVKSYQEIVRHLSNFHIPIYWIPGNHDNLDKMEFVFKNAKNFNRKTTLYLPDWHFIFLSTKIDGRDDGELSQFELNTLRNEIKLSPPHKKTAIIMHHHPTPVGTPLIDNYILKNTKEFWEIITGTKVNLVICGHVHGDYRFKHNDIMIETSPATCLQWQKGTGDLKVEMKIGYKIYYFGKDDYTTEVKMW